MEKDIFKDSKFGDKFMTKDGRVALYVMNDNPFHVCVVTPLYNKNPIFWSYNADGTSLDEAFTSNGINIVSRYQEPIDEGKLDELAENYSISEFAMTHEDSTESAIAYKAYKAGYLSAFNNKTIKG